MSETKQMRVLLVDLGRGRSAIFERALSGTGEELVGILGEGDNLIEQVTRLQPDILIIDLESPGMELLEQLSLIAHDTPVPVLMFSDDSSRIRQAIEAGVSAYVVDGLSGSRIKPLMDLALVRFAEYRALKDELIQARSTLEERKVIDRAKGIIMKHKGCDEETAYQLLRKTAMSNNQRLIDVARQLITTQGLLG